MVLADQTLSGLALHGRKTEECVRVSTNNEIHCAITEITNPIEYHNIAVVHSRVTYFAPKFTFRLVKLDRLLWVNSSLSVVYQPRGCFRGFDRAYADQNLVRAWRWLLDVF